MKTLSLLIAVAAGIFCSNSYSQEVKARSGGISFDFTPTTQKIVWITPVLEQGESESKKLEIKIGIKSKIPIEKVAIVLNGLPVANNRGFMLKKSDDDRFDQIVEHSLSLADGDNHIRVVIEDIEGWYLYFPKSLS